MRAATGSIRLTSTCLSLQTVKKTNTSAKICKPYRIQNRCPSLASFCTDIQSLFILYKGTEYKVHVNLLMPHLHGYPGVMCLPHGGTDIGAVGTWEVFPEQAFHHALCIVSNTAPPPVQWAQKVRVCWVGSCWLDMWGGAVRTRWVWVGGVWVGWVTALNASKPLLDHFLSCDQK